MKRVQVIKEIIVVIIAVAMIFCIRNIVDEFFASMFSSEILVSRISAIFSHLAVGLLIYLVYKIMPEMKLEISKSCHLNTLYYEVVGVILISGVIRIIAMILDRFINNDLITASNNEAVYTDLVFSEIAVMIISSAILGPIIEELVFRGILLNSLNRIMGIKSAVIVSSVIFGLLHGTSLVVIISATAGGIALACIYLIHKNLLNSIIVHGIYNLMVTISIMRPRLPVEMPDLVSDMNVAIMIFTSLTLIIICVAMGTYVIKRLKKGYAKILDIHPVKEKALKESVLDMLCIEKVNE